MPIVFHCDGCRKRYEVAESFAGKRAKCKGCGAPMTIPGPRPKASSAPPADAYGLDDDVPAAKSEGEMLLPRGAAGRRPSGGAAPSGVPGWVWLAVGGVGLLLIVLVLGVVFGGRTKDKAVAQNAPSAGGDDESTPPSATPPAAEAGRFQRDTTSAASAVPSWRVKVDPSPEPLEFPALAKLSIPVPEAYGGDDILFPTTPSPFVIMGGNSVAEQFRDVWDLRTATRVGRLKGKIETAKPMALSPDGAYFATHTNPVPRTTDIWRVADAQRVGRIQDGENIPDFLDFAGPNRLVIGTTYAKLYQVWDFQAGKPVVQVAVPATWGIDRESHALSPGRRYLGLAFAQGNRVHVYDLTNGRLAGEIELEKDGIYNLDCEGLAFAPDGSALAGLFTAAGMSTHLMCWDAATGKLENDFRTEGRDPYGKSFAYQAQALQWLPDKMGWLVHDQAIVERKSGQTAWTLPFDKKRNMVEGPRKLLDGDRMIAPMKIKERKTLQLVALPKDKIQAAMALAKGGGSAVDALLPATQAADVAAAKRVKAPEGPVKWAYQLDPAVAPKGKLVRTITLRAGALDLLGLICSGPTTAQALVVSSPGARLDAAKSQQGKQPRQVDRYDLATGRPLGQFEVPPISLPAAFSPEATHVLLTHSGSPDRVDVHTVADGKHVVGWRPYERESGDDKNVAWADFLSATKVLTVNPSGTLVLWSLPECKAVYVAEHAVQGVPLLSPGRKSLALLQGGSLRLLDPATGTPQGDAPAAGHSAEAGLKAAAFRPDGQELAALVGDAIVRWDLKTGKISGDEAPPPSLKALALQYGGDHHVLLDNKVLFDLGRKRPVLYMEGGLHASGSPDGSHWYAAGPITGPATLTAVEFPDKSTASAEAAADDPKTRAILRSGATVGIQVTGAPTREAEEFRRELIGGLTARLQALGAKVADNQPVRIVAHFQEKDLGQPIELRKLGGGSQNAETRSMAARDLEWTLAVADNQGEPIVFARGTVGARGFGIQHLPVGENDWEGYLRARQWRAGSAQAIAQEVPFFVARRPGGVAVLPGRTNLGHPQF